MFSKNTYAVVYGLQLKAIQNMLDFDFLCGRNPSVLAIVNSQSRNHSNYKIFWVEAYVTVDAIAHCSCQ